MRHFLPFILIASFILVSCAPAIGVQQVTPTPSMTATPLPTITPSATATPKVEVLPSVTPVPTKEVQVGPSDEVLNQVLFEAGVTYSPDTTNEVVDENGVNRCTFKYSDGVLKNSQINYIQYPDIIKDYMCYQVWSKVMMLQRDNVLFLTEEFGIYPILSDSQTLEVQSEMRESAKKVLDEHGQIPFTFWNYNPDWNVKDTKVFTNDISEIEFNHLSREEYQKLENGLDAGFVTYSKFRPFEIIGDANIIQDMGMLLFVKDKKLLVYSYNWGSPLDIQPGGIKDPRIGYTALEHLKHKEPEYMYSALMEEFRDSMGMMRLHVVPQDQWGKRWEEFDFDELFGSILRVNGDDLKDFADQTLNPLHKSTPTP